MVLQCFSLQELHRNEGLEVLLSDVIDSADVGMVESRSGLGFTPEALQRLLVLSHVLRKKLQGNKTVEPRVLGLINHTHPATTKLLKDAVVGDGLADHWRWRRNSGAMLGVVRRRSQRWAGTRRNTVGLTSQLMETVRSRVRVRL